MPYGRNLQINGRSRQVCLNQECKTRIGNNKSESCIIDKNFCSKHQPINLREYVLNKTPLPNNYLTVDDNMKQWLQIIFEIEKIKTIDDIYTFERSKVLTKYVPSIMSKFPDICTDIIRLFPELNLKWYKFKVIPNNCLDKEHNRRELFDAFLSDNNIDLNSDNIYNISLTMIEKHKAQTLINYYRHSIYDIISNLYPERELLPWKFKFINFYFHDKYDNLSIENIKKWFNYEIVSKFDGSSFVCEDEKLKHVLTNITSVDFEMDSGGSFLWNLMRGSIFKFINKR
jgi:hypothetical protein